MVDTETVTQVLLSVFDAINFQNPNMPLKCSDSTRVVSVAPQAAHSA